MSLVFINIYFNRWSRAFARASSIALLAVTLPLERGVADQRELPNQRSAVDVVLVFDASGSMLKTDPRNLRFEGAKLLLSFLSDSDRISVVRFADSAKIVRDLGQYSKSMAPQLMEQIQTIAPEGQYSDVSEGIKLAKAVLDASHRAEAQKLIVLLSDGKMEPDPKISPAFARTLELVHDLLPDLKAKETKVFTLAFSEFADRPLLSEIAAATDGLTWYTATPEDLHRSFAELFLAVKRPQVVAQTGRGFKIDDDVEEATFYINREPGNTLSLIPPKGELLSLAKHPDWVTWFSGQNFDVITLKEPDPGDWRVTGTEHSDGFATVLTDLKVLTDWPLVVRSGDTPLVQARLYEQSKPVSLPEMSEVLKFGVQIARTDQVATPMFQEALRDDGKGGDKVALDGIFSIPVRLDQIGEYKLTIVAKSPTFVKSQQIPFSVRPRLVSLEVGASHDNHDYDDTPKEPAESGHEVQAVGARVNEDSTLRVRVSKETLAYKEAEIVVELLSSDRRKIKIPMKRDGDSALVYSTTLHHVNEDGEYTATAFLRGLTKKGEGIEAASRSIRVMFARQSKEEPTPEHIVVEPKEEKKAASPVIPIVPIGIVIGLGSLAAVALMSRTKKQAKSSASSVGKYVPHKQLIDAISTLEEKISTTSVEINDPIFSMLDKQGDVVAPRTSSAQAEVRQPGDAEEKSAVAPQAQDSAVTQESVMAALPDDV
jgi:Mg-chelatase subunit ChlD